MAGKGRACPRGMEAALGGAIPRSSRPVPVIPSEGAGAGLLLAGSSDSSHKGATFPVSPTVGEMAPFPQHRRIGGPLRPFVSLLRQNVMTEQATGDPHRDRREPTACSCAHTAVDIVAAPSYQLPMLFRADSDLADRPDPERQGPGAEDRRGDGDPPESPRARLSIPPAAALMTTDRSPSSFTRHTARSAPPSPPATASALATQRFSDNHGVATTMTSCRRADCAPAPHRHSSATNGGAPTDTPPTDHPPKGTEW
jgi:hypothetical protein